MKMFTQQMNLVSVTETLTSTRHLYTIIVVTPVISYTIPKPQKNNNTIDTHTLLHVQHCYCNAAL